MKKESLIVIIIFLYVSFNVVAQETNQYIEYYKLINVAKTLKEQQLYDSCLTTYQKAFAKVEYVHNENLQDAASICKKLGLKTQAKIYLERVKSQKNQINKSHKNYLDSLQNRDQKVRTSKFLKAKKYYYRSLYDSTFVSNEKRFSKSKTLMEEWWSTDSLNIELVKKFISKYGFPGEKMVGAMTNGHVAIMILHYDKDTANHVMGEILKTALFDGNILPRDYAWIIDRHLLHAGKPQLYHSIPCPYPNCLSEEERETANSNRESIGLKKLEELKIVYRKKSVTVRHK